MRENLLSNVYNSSPQHDLGMRYGDSSIDSHGARRGNSETDLIPLHREHSDGDFIANEKTLGGMGDLQAVLQS